MDDLVKKLRSQIGDDVQEIYSHEALFKLAADRIEELERINAAQLHTLGHMGLAVEAMEAAQARAERAEAMLKEAVKTLQSMDDTIVARSELFISDQECLYNLRDRIRRARIAAQEGKE